MASRGTPSVIMRGGTSKAVFLREGDLPPEGEERDAVILRIFGSPDKRQIDGLGGADPLTSKVAIIAPPRVPGTDLTYTFGQVEIERPVVDYKSLCGNISAAVGHFAVSERLVALSEPLTVVRAFNTNLQRVLSIEVPVQDGAPIDEGDYRIPGVPGSAAKISVDFSDTAGGATGRLLPTGRPTDVLSMNGFGNLEVSLVDIGNAHVFVRARDIGLRGIETPAKIDGDRSLRERLEQIRGAAAFTMGMVSDPRRAREETPATPILGIVAPSQSYVSYLDGETIDERDTDLVARLMFMQIAHKAYAGTSTVCTGVAARIPGTLVAEALRTEAHERLDVRIGHPAGVIVTESRVERDGEGWAVRRATLGRTARRLMAGTVYVSLNGR